MMKGKKEENVSIEGRKEERKEMDELKSTEGRRKKENYGQQRKEKIKK